MTRNLSTTSLKSYRPLVDVIQPDSDQVAVEGSIAVIQTANEDVQAAVLRKGEKQRLG